MSTKEVRRIRLFGVEITQEVDFSTTLQSPQEPSPPARSVLLPTDTLQLPNKVHTVIQQLGGTNIIFLGNKEITASDVNKNLNRFFVPKDHILEVLTQDEIISLGLDGRGKIKKRNTNNEQGGAKGVEAKIEAAVVDGRGITYDMDFKNWPSLEQPVLLTQWNKLVKEYRLNKGDSIQIWCFRDVNLRLCFVVAKNEDRTSVSGLSHIDN